MLLAAATVAAPVRAPAQGPTTPAFAANRLARIDTVLQSYVDSNRIGGAVALVLRDGHVVYRKAVGWSDKEAHRAMTQDAMFRIASQTKALTSVAILQLVERGVISLDDPVSKYLPSFAHTTVATSSDTGRVIAPARRQITIRDLLTHTSGISYGVDDLVAPLYAAKGLGPAAGWGWYTADKDEPVCTTMDRLGALPFLAQPGERWIYGYSYDVLGCVVARASGVPFDRYIREHITAPLRMNDTYFFPPAAKRDRVVAVYASDSTGHAVRAPAGPKGQGDYLSGPRRSFSGGAGLISTAADYARFLEMIRRGGALDGARILAPHTVALMTHNQIGTRYPDPGHGFGFGFAEVDTYGASGMESVGSYGWGGAYGSIYFVDPVERMVVVFMINQLPNSADVAGKFPTLVYGALMAH
jgi:CubicO group peptidase (beta-lactamase class C family)